MTPARKAAGAKSAAKTVAGAKPGTNSAAAKPAAARKGPVSETAEAAVDPAAGEGTH